MLQLMPTAQSHTVHLDLPGPMWYSGDVKYLVDHASARWLVDAIAAYQTDRRLVNDHRFAEYQLWELTVHPDYSATLTARVDSESPPALSHTFDCTTFPLKHLVLWVVDSTLYCQVTADMTLWVQIGDGRSIACSTLGEASEAVGGMGSVTEWVNNPYHVGAMTRSVYGSDFITMYWGTSDGHVIRGLNTTEQAAIQCALERPYR